MYVGDDVSPDFYGWVFPKYDHVGVGTGTVVNRPAIKEYQDATRKRAGKKIEGGKIIKIEAHPIPEHYRPKRVSGRAVLVGCSVGAARLSELVAAVPAMVMGYAIGARVRPHIDPPRFRQAVMVLLTATAFITLAGALMAS